MMHTRWMIGFALLAAVLAAVPGSVAAAQSPVTVTAAISGQVQPLQLAASGQVVKQGDIILFVRTSTGSAIPAARAPVDGRIVQVLVNAGDRVNIGDPVAVIEPN